MFLDRISCINFIISLAILDTSHLNMHFFSVHIHVYVDFKTDCILTYASMREMSLRVRLAGKTLTLSCLIPAVLVRDCLVFIKDTTDWCQV